MESLVGLLNVGNWLWEGPGSCWYTSFFCEELEVLREGSEGESERGSLL